jgi:hypothetical protein
LEEYAQYTEEKHNLVGLTNLRIKKRAVINARMNAKTDDITVHLVDLLEEVVLLPKLIDIEIGCIVTIMEFIGADSTQQQFMMITVIICTISMIFSLLNNIKMRGTVMV